jgi:hypothetical protein
MELSATAPTTATGAGHSHAPATRHASCCGPDLCHPGCEERAKKRLPEIKDHVQQQKERGGTVD